VWAVLHYVQNWFIMRCHFEGQYLLQVTVCWNDNEVGPNAVIILCHVQHFAWGDIWNEKMTCNPFPGKDKIQHWSNFENLWAVYGDIHYITNLFCQKVLKYWHHGLGCELTFFIHLSFYYSYVSIVRRKCKDQILSKLPAGNNMLSGPCLGNGCNISDMNQQKIQSGPRKCIHTSTWKILLYDRNYSIYTKAKLVWEMSLNFGFNVGHYGPSGGYCPWGPKLTLFELWSIRGLLTPGP
jgi:hypothetical protein